MRALGLDATEGTHYHRDAVDGRPIGNRYRTACLGRIGAFSETYAHLGLDHAPRQGTESEDSNPPGCCPKPGAIGGRVASLPAVHHPRQAFLITMRSQANWLLSALQAAPATKMH